jgi:lycopene cyclase domain-containing protein
MLNLNLTPNLSFSNFEYLLLISIVFVPTFLLTFHPKSQLRKNLKVVILSILIVAIPWILWDIWATNRGHWGFNSDFYLGVKIFNLPIEEVMFFFAVPFSCLYLWSIIRDFKSFRILWEDLLNKS